MANLETLKQNPLEYRFQGSVPKIGIRPTIDGRQNGVRESLEAQTMGLAKMAAKLISDTLRHPNGMPVECVIADTTIGGVYEAAGCEEKFSKSGVDVTLTVTPCWCYGSETMDMNPMTIKAVWGFNGTERPGAVYLAAVLAAHNQKGLPAFGIYGRDVQNADASEIPIDVKEKILSFARNALAVAWMRGKSYLSVGGVSMGIAGSIVDADFFQAYLGMRTESVDMSEMIRRINEKIYDEEEFKKALAWTKENCKEGSDNNGLSLQHSRQKKDETWETCVKCALIMRDMMIGNKKLTARSFGEESNGHNAILSGFQGQRNWTDFMPNGDFLESILTSSFDWNGIREPFVVATENDALNGVSMLFGHLVTGSASIFSDVRTYWSPEAVKKITGWDPEDDAKNGFIHLINSGATCLDGTGKQRKNGKPAMKPFWEISKEEAGACLDATTWRPGSLGYFRGGGFSSQFLTDGNMNVTMFRLNLIKGLGPVLQIAEGVTTTLPVSVNQVLDKRTDPTWPTTWFVPRLTGKGSFSDVYTVMAKWGANHAAISYGHIGADLITLASMLRIPVCMHNVDESKIFRPSYWNAFGDSSEGSDYRSCAALGPLYSKK